MFYTLKKYMQHTRINATILWNNSYTKYDELLFFCSILF